MNQVIVYHTTGVIRLDVNNGIVKHYTTSVSLTSGFLKQIDNVIIPV